MSDSFTESWIARFLFSVIAIVGLLGNALVIWVFIRKRKTYTPNPFDVFILNLAVSDFLSAVFLVFSRFLYLPTMPNSQPEAFLLCSFLWGGYILFGFGYVSVYTCLVLTIERWLAVVKPHFRLQRKTAMLTIIIVWIWGFFINFSVFLTVEQDFDNGKCTWIAPKVGKAVLPIFEIFFTCVFPFSIIIFLYAHIFYTINRLPLFTKRTGLAIKKRLTVIALVASIALVVGWLPTQISYVLRYIRKGRIHLEETVHFIFIMLTFIGNSCINPVLYGIYSSRFRKEYSLIVFEIFRKIPGKVACMEG